MVRARSPRFFFFFLFLFFSTSLFSLFFSISLAPRLRRDALIFLFAFLHIFVFSFCSYFCFSFCFFLFDFFSLFFLLFFILVFSLSFLFAFSFFLLLFLSLFFGFLLLSLLFFLVFIFDSPFLFCLSFCFTFLPSSLQSLSSLSKSNRSPAIHFFYSDANLSHSIQPLPTAAKKKKISAKESTGGRWPHGSERAEGRKAEGRNGMK